MPGRPSRCRGPSGRRSAIGHVAGQGWPPGKIRRCTAAYVAAVEAGAWPRAADTKCPGTGVAPGASGMQLWVTSSARTTSIVGPGLMLGVGLGGFVDGIVFHQIL